jgi:hypothetical protein
VRTTLTLDEPVAARLRNEVRRTGKPLKVVVNEALKRGLGMQEARPVRRFRVVPRAFAFRPGVDLDRLNQLIDELDNETRATKLRR